MREEVCARGDRGEMKRVHACTYNYCSNTTCNIADSCIVLCTSL